MIVMKMKLEFADWTPASARVKKVFERVTGKAEDEGRKSGLDESRLETMSLGALLYYALMGEGIAL
jgi:hypothetical protein